MNQLEISNVSDQELMSHIASNDLEAWAELVKRYSNLVYSIAYQILKNNSDTEDAMQDTFISLKIYANKFDNTQELKPWLSRVAANQAIRIYKKRKNNNNKESNWMKTKSISEDSQKLDVASITEKQEVQLMVRKAIDTLPEASRVALTLYFCGGMNQTEIANELGLSQFSISEKIKLGLEKVKSYLKNSGVHASILVSPQLVKESIVSTPTPNTLLIKLANQIPSASQMEKVASNSRKIGVAAAKSKTSFVLASLLAVTTIFFVLGYFLWSSKNKETAPAILPKVLITQNSKSKNNPRTYRPIDFAGMVPFDINLSKENNSSLATIGEVSVNKWKLAKQINGSDLVVRDFYQKGKVDGFLLSKAFDKPSLFHGYIKLNSEKTDFYFSINTSNTKKINIKENDSNAFFSSFLTGHLINFYLLPKEELEFKLFIWLNHNRWESICLVYLNKKHLPDQDYYCWQEFVNQEFALSMFSDGNVELRDFGYCDLEPEWKPETEPDLKSTMDRIAEKPFLKK